MSDLVLKDDHLDGLLEAIAEGRTAYLNVKKAVQYLVATNVSELSVMALSVAAGLPDPLDPLATRSFSTRHFSVKSGDEFTIGYF